jgi:hypothetical protein
LRTIQLSWTSFSEYEEFLAKNISSQGSYSFVSQSNMIIIYDVPERIDFIETYIKKKDSSNTKLTVLSQSFPVFLKIAVRDYEIMEYEKELESIKTWEFSKTSPVIYSSWVNDEPVYNIEMVGLKAILWFERISNQRVALTLDVFYDYVMGWNNKKEPVIDRTHKTLEKIAFFGDAVFFNEVEFGNRIIDCEVKIGYNNLTINNSGR